MGRCVDPPMVELERLCAVFGGSRGALEALLLAAARGARDAPLGRDRLDDVGLLGLALEVLVVLAVAEHAEVAVPAVVGVDGDAGEDLLPLVEAEPFEVE